MTSPDAPPDSASDDATAHALDAQEAWQIEMQLPQLHKEGQHELAAALGERLLEIREAALGPSHPDVVLLLSNMAESYIAISRYERAEAVLQRALQAHGAAASPDSNDLGRVLAQLAKLYRRSGALDKAEPLLRRALEVHKAAPEPDFPAMASALHGRALLLEDLGKLDEAERVCREALEMREKLFGPNTLPVAESLNTLAVMHRRKGDLESAERLYLRVLAVREAKQSPGHRDIVTTLFNLGRLYTEWERHDAAREFLERAHSSLEARGGAADELLCHVLEGLAGHYDAAGDPKMAVEFSRRALAVLEELLGPSHPNLASALNNLAAKLIKASDTRDVAETLVRRALSLLDDNPGAREPAVVVTTLLNLAHSRIMDGDVDEAEALTLRAQSLVREAFGADSYEMGAVFGALSDMAKERGDLNQAIELACQALKARGKRPSIAQGIADFVRIGKLFLEGDMPDEAAKCFRDALDLAARTRGKDHPSVGDILFFAGKVALAEKDPKRALHCLKTSVEIGEKAFGRLNYDLIDRLSALAEAQTALSKWGAAEATYRTMGEIYAKTFPGEHDWQAIAPALLGDMYMKRKAHAKAAEFFEQALSLGEKAYGPDHMRLHVLLEKAGAAHQDAGSPARAEELSLRLLAMLEKELGPDDPGLFRVVARITDIYVRTKDPRMAEWLPRTVKLLEARTAQMQAETAKKRAELARRTGRS